MCTKGGVGLDICNGRLLVAMSKTSISQSVKGYILLPLRTLVGTPKSTGQICVRGLRVARRLGAACARVDSLF